MKKIISLVLCICCVMCCITSCAGNGDTPTTSGDTTVDATNYAKSSFEIFVSGKDGEWYNEYVPENKEQFESYAERAINGVVPDDSIAVIISLADNTASLDASAYENIDYHSADEERNADGALVCITLKVKSSKMQDAVDDIKALLANEQVKKVTVKTYSAKIIDE